ncbi:MAG: rhomboid family intramembrane serine protease [Candidatus Levybacteria bacterium]|nr:rhomboid family intramembrane serine protease [Candidatus Levybacteria bacterium]
MIPLSDSVKSQRFPFINILLIGITVYVFFQQYVTPDPEAFVYRWALIPSEIDFSNWLTLIPFITAIFLHGGFLHIISNMLFLWVFGDNVEGYMHLLLYPILYLGSGIVGALTQYFFMPNSDIPMLGASGAVAGVLGAYYMLFPHHKIKTLVPLFGFFTVINISASFMLGYWFLLQIISGAASLPFSGETGGIAFFAHIGGFVFGIIFAKFFAYKNLPEIAEG